MPADISPLFVTILVLTLGAVVPLTGLWEQGRLRVWTAAGRRNARLRIYAWIMVFEWALTAVLLAWAFGAGLDAAALRLLPRADGWQWLALVLGLGAAGLLVAQMNMVVRSEERLDEVRARMGDLELLAPRGAREIRAFDRLSITAGVCEEILYRGVLLAVLAQAAGTWPAVVLSSLVFGLGHLYQGALGVAKTSGMGFVLALLAVLSGSLYVPMVLHATVDLTSGRMMAAAQAGRPRGGEEEGPPPGGRAADARSDQDDQ